MTEDEIRNAVLRVLAQIRPEADLSALAPNTAFADQIGFDSVDFLEFALGLESETGIAIPEVDYLKLATLAGACAYLRDRASNKKAA